MKAIQLGSIMTNFLIHLDLPKCGCSCYTGAKCFHHIGLGCTHTAALTALTIAGPRILYLSLQIQESTWLIWPLTEEPCGVADHCACKWKRICFMCLRLCCKSWRLLNKANSTVINLRGWEMETHSSLHSGYKTQCYSCLQIQSSPSSKLQKHWPKFLWMMKKKET